VKRSSAGLRRREAEGLRVDDMGPVITVMMGRLEDWLRTQTERDGIVSDPAALPWSGVAVFKRTAAEFARRGLRARPLGAAIRHHLHWSELIGGDVIITCRPPGSAASTPRTSRSGRGWTTRSTRPSSTT
jgi:transaldolase